MQDWKNIATFRINQNVNSCTILNCENQYSPTPPPPPPRHSYDTPCLVTKHTAADNTVSSELG